MQNQGLELRYSKKFTKIVVWIRRLNFFAMLFFGMKFHQSSTHMHCVAC